MPLNQVQVEDEIYRLAALAEQTTHDMARHAQEAAEARTEYKVAQARALLAASGTVAEKEAQATVATASLLKAREDAEAVERATQEAGRNYRAQLDSLRSINANLRPLVTS